MNTLYRVNERPHTYMDSQIDPIIICIICVLESLHHAVYF